MIEDGIKISELGQATTINNEDLIPIVQNEETKNITYEDLFASNNVKGDVYKYNLTTISGNISPSAWNNACSNYTTETIPSGDYLVICSITYTGTGSGISSTDMVIDGTRIGNVSRQTVPMVNGLGSTTNATHFVTFNTTSTHTLNISTYCNVAVTPNNAFYKLIRLK